jgi:hypothetical protein
MPIIKLKKHQDQIPYDMVSREVVQSITNPIALAIWVYLQSQAEDWDVIESHIRKHFAIGQRKYQKAMKELKELGLYDVIFHKNDNNQFTGNHFHVYHSPVSAFSAGAETRRCGNVTYIKEEETIKEEESIKEKDISTQMKQFEVFRSKYLGKKRGCETEFKNFITKHKDWEEVLNTLEMINPTLSWLGVTDKQYVPHLQTFINNRNWEMGEAQSNKQPSSKLFTMEDIA